MISKRALVAVTGKLMARVGRARRFVDSQDRLAQSLRAFRGRGAEPGLDGKVVVITGSSRGIGFALANEFARAGARVVLNGRDAAALGAALEVLRRRHPAAQAAAVCADVGTEEGAAQLLAGTLQAFGAGDVLINNAGVVGALPAPAWTVAAADWRRAMDTNLNGAFFCSEAFMAWMMASGRPGRIICVSSAAVLQPVPRLAAYATSKVALEGLIRNLAADADGTGILVTGIQLESTQSDVNRRHLSWADYQQLIPAEAHMPAFVHAATSDPGRLHGRVLASWRFNEAPEQEAWLAGPLSTSARAAQRPRQLPSGVAARDAEFLELGENQLGASPRVKAFLQGAGSSFNVSLYPDMDNSALRGALAASLGLPPESFAFGNGSSELVERVLRVFLRPGEAVISNLPTWYVFDQMARKLGVPNVKVPFAQDPGRGWHHNLEGILAAVCGTTRLIYLVHPSNPVGTPLLDADFRGFLERLPQHVPVILDEAYIEFADRSRGDLLDSAQLVKTTARPILVLRTFSKIYGLAGLRVGYAFAAPGAIRLLETLELTFNTASLSAEAARIALEDREHCDRVYENNATEKARVAGALRELGLGFVPSETNMLLAECPTVKPATYFDALRAHGILTSPNSYFDRYVLWPIGLPRQNDRILSAVRELL